MSYQNVVQKADTYPVQSMEIIGEGTKARAETPNSNRASEGSNRETFNNAYSTITNGKSNQYDLIYKVSDYTSKLSFRKDGNESAYNYGYEGNGGAPINGVDEQYSIKANTYNTYGGTLTKIKTESDIRKNSVLEIADINLGIEKRAQPDMSLVKDLNTAKVTINQSAGVTEHIYQYADRFNPDLYAENGGNGFDMNPQVRFGSKYGSMSYTRVLYSSDVYYKENSDQKEGDQLRVYLTYKIGIKNTSDIITSVINEIEDYYDTKYENHPDKIKIGKQIKTNGDIQEGSELQYEFANSGSDQYYKIKIKDINLEIAPQKEEYIYVQLEVKEEQIIELLSGDTKLDNIAEISSYSSKGKDNKAYAGIDQDSQPGNMKVGDLKTYEDDTDKAPGLMLVLQEERSINGMVFIDSTTGELQSGQIRQGDGIYTSKEVGVEGVTITLINTRTDEIANKYNKAKQIWEPAITTTNEKGEYHFEGIVPDEYKIIYTWGGQKYTDSEGQEKQITVQDYKGTIYQELDRETNREWYKAKEPRYSDAVDDYDERLRIDEQTNIITNAKKQAINNVGGEIELESGEKEELITQMNATTPSFRVNIEYNTANTDHKEEYVIEDGKIKMNGPYAVKKDEYKNEIQHIDFGIVERARQALALEKRIKAVKLVLANGTVIVNSKINEDGTLENPVKHAIYVPASQGAGGQIKFELDSEIAQGAKVEVEYGLEVVNISELEYINKNYYIYGEGHGENKDQLVELQANKVIDYLNNSISTDVEGDNIGELISDTNKMYSLMDQGLLENSAKMRNLLNMTKGVIVIDALSQSLKPEGIEDNDTKVSVTLKGQKLIANNDESALENNAEIIEIKKTGGSSLVAIPGNYIPSTNSSEYDDSKSENVEIVPPTGLSIDYIAYTLLGISSLGILTAGIVLIKKFVLK